MLEIIVFFGICLLVVVGLLFIGQARRARVGASPRERTPSRGRTWGLGLSLAFVYVVFIGVVPAIVLIGNHNNASAHIGNVKLTADEKEGRILFGEHCGMCHTLAAANAVGKTGPNLDTLQPSDALVLHTLANGCLQSPPTPTSPQACLGEGTMPADVVEQAGRAGRSIFFSSRRTRIAFASRLRTLICYAVK